MSSNCLFCRMLSGEIPVNKVYEDDQAFAFRDINPQAPTHVLVIPRRHVAALSEASDEDQSLLGHLSLVATRVAQQEGVAESGYRTVINSGLDAGQSVLHLHVHVLGGRPLNWPPG